MITSAANREVRALRRLRTKQNRERRGLVLIEGRAALLEVCRAGGVLDRVVATPRGEASCEDAIRAARDAGAAKVVVSEEIMSLLCSTQEPPPVLGIAKRPVLQPIESPSFCWLYVSEEHDPGALGAILRAAVAYGVSAVWTSPGSVDPFDPRTIRASRAAVFRVPVATGASLEACLDKAASVSAEAMRLPEGRPEVPSLPSKLLLILVAETDSLRHAMPIRAVSTHPGLPVALALPVLLDAWMREHAG